MPLLIVFIMLVSLLDCVTGEVIAVVDGKKIYKEDLITTAFELYPQQMQDTLDRVINAIVIMNEAQKRKITVSEDEVDMRIAESGLRQNLPEIIRTLIKSALLAEKMIIKDKNLTASPAEIKKFYEENKHQFVEPERVHIRHILLHDETEAEDIAFSLRVGADFAKMAERKSKDNVSAARGGDLGMFTRGILLPEIESIVFNMKEGEISGPIKTSAGYHIIKLEKKIPAKEISLNAELQKRIKELIIRTKVREHFPSLINDLRSKSKIEIKLQ